jgi:tetratricopeptide (TPR) repeat protein
MRDPTTFIWLIYGIAIGVPLMLAAEAVLLRAACHVRGVEVPRFWRAVWLTVKAMVLSSLLAGLFALCAGMGAAPGDHATKEAVERSAWITRIGGLFCMIFLPAAIYGESMGIGFGKGLQIRLIEGAIALGLGLLVGGVTFLGMWTTGAVSEYRNKRETAVRVAKAERDKITSAAAAEVARKKLHEETIGRTAQANELLRAGKSHEAVEAFRDVTNAWKELAGGAPQENEYRLEYARGTLILADLLLQTGQGKEAEATYREAGDLWKTLAEEHPDHPQYQHSWARSSLQLGTVIYRSGRGQESLPGLRDAVAKLGRLALEYPKERDNRLELARGHAVVGLVLAEAGGGPGAEAEFRQTLDLTRQLLAESPQDSDVKHLEATGRFGLALLLLRTGQPKAAEPVLRECLSSIAPLATGNPENREYQRSLAMIQDSLGAVFQGTARLDQAAAADRQAIAIWGRLEKASPLFAEEHDEFAGALTNLGIVCRKQKDIEHARGFLLDAVPQHEAALSGARTNPKYRLNYRNNRSALAETLVDLGQHAEGAKVARELLQNAVDPRLDSYVAARCLSRCAGLVDGGLASLLQSQWPGLNVGYAWDAVRALKQAVANGYREPDRKTEDRDFSFLRLLVRHHGRFGEEMRLAGHFRGAQMNYDGAIETRSVLAAAFPAVTEYQKEIAVLELAAGEVDIEAGWLQNAEQVYKDALSRFEALAKEFSAQPEYRQQIGRCHARLGEVFGREKQPKLAENNFREALAIQGQLVADFPDSLSYRHELAKSHAGLGIFLAAEGKAADGEAELRKSQDIYKEIAAAPQAQPIDRVGLVESHQELGGFFLRAAKTKEAETEFLESLAIGKLIAAASPRLIECRQRLAKGYLLLGDLFKRTERLTDAEKAYQEAEPLWKRLADDQPKAPLNRRQLADTHDKLGTLHLQAGRLAEAVADFDQALALNQKLLADFQEMNDQRYAVAESMFHMAQVLFERKEFQRARGFLERAHSPLMGAYYQDMKNPTYLSGYRANRRLLCRVLLELADHHAAVDMSEELWRVPGHVAQDAYDAACYEARCVILAEKDPRLSETDRKESIKRYGRNAAYCLLTAAERGWKDIDQMEKDPRLEPIRTMIDYKQVMANLKKKK